MPVAENLSAKKGAIDIFVASISTTPALTQLLMTSVTMKTTVIASMLKSVSVAQKENLHSDTSENTLTGYGIC